MKPQEKAAGTKEKILTRVLPLFLVNNYESITIGLMEDATRLTRGTIYRYFNNKEDIFKQALFRYYDSQQNVLFAMDPDRYILTEYWKLKIQQLESAYLYLREYGILVDMLAISHYIEVQGMRIIPTFRDLIVSHKHRNLKFWSLVLRNTPDITLNTKKISYQRAGQIYHGLFMQLCSNYPNVKLTLPNISFS
ncbi:MAG: TetR/AcrR family transcriptional regulator [Muribaculaceae bacterium]|nr:TetR/AcrR family transcriptional regulator [Muribaculaceae bacterium]